MLMIFLLPNIRLVYQSFETSTKTTRYHQSTWHYFDTIKHWIRTLDLSIVSQVTSPLDHSLRLPAVNFINILCAHFLYESASSSFFLLTCN